MVGEFMIDTDDEDSLDDILDGYSNGDLVEAITNADRIDVIAVETVDVD